MKPLESGFLSGGIVGLCAALGSVNMEHWIFKHGEAFGGRTADCDGAIAILVLALWLISALCFGFCLHPTKTKGRWIAFGLFTLGFFSSFLLIQIFVPPR